MSAPLVVNTKDGVCWTRRQVTAGGIALYAPEQMKTCPDFVMATLEDLAEQGIAGSAFALPVPVASEPQKPASSKVVRIVAEVSNTESARDAEYAEDRVEYVLEEQGYEARVWIDTGGGQEIAGLRARVAELEAERHSTNESLSRAAEALRADRDRIAELEAEPSATYRAEQHAAGLVLCTYSNLAAAQAHCEDWARRELGSAPTFDWIPDDEDDPAVWELVAQVGDDESETGFSVTVADIAVVYDPDGDE